MNTQLLHEQKQKQEHLLALLKKENLENIIVPIVKLEKEIVLVEARCECKKCGKTEELQYHHLITRDNREYINDEIQYIRLRHHWRHIIILCAQCHKERHSIHQRKNKSHPQNIPKEKINKIIKKYEI
jgi:5-methylcytosine-specific restriction endonuclease McrA